MRFAFAGDRDISVWALDYLLSVGAKPLALLVSAPERASHATELIARCSYLEGSRVLQGQEFRTGGLATLRSLELDLIVGVHFPYLVPEEVLRVPRLGVLNLHPAYLPYNRGWHTPSWTILEETPAGATLHFMDAGIDTGDIVHQKRLELSPADTAHSLYERLKELELEVFTEAWPWLMNGDFPRRAQLVSSGTTHKRADLLRDSIQRIELEEPIRAGELLKRLRALTTNRIEEAAFFEVEGRRYRVQVSIEEE